MKAYIINIGDELLLGDTVNTNGSWMASVMDSVGFEVIQIKIIGDEEEEIVMAIDEAFLRAEIILITGGLGPTHDDITKHTLCKYFNDVLIKDNDVLKDVETILSHFGKKINEINMKQAMVPSKCEIVRNKRGTAPGMIFRKKEKIIISMPGVPHEMKSMMENDILPMIRKNAHGSIRLHKYLKTFGIAEANLVEILHKVIENMNQVVKLAFLPSAGQVKLRLTATGKSELELKKILEREEQLFIENLGTYLYGFSKDSMASVLGELLIEKGKTVATAESCTGGTLASKITSIPGSSAYYIGSVITYTNKLKIQELNISESMLKEHGAVSEPVVIRMAEAIREKFGTDIGLSTSGIAGPDGGTNKKPVGTIWIGMSFKNRTKAIKIKLNYNRKVNIDLTSDHAMNLLRLELQGKV